MALCLQSCTKGDRGEGTESEMASAGFWKIQINMTLGDEHRMLAALESWSNK